MGKSITLPLTPGIIEKLRCGDEVLVSGRIYTARDQAHRRLVSTLAQKKRLPIDLKGEVIYYCGPTSARPGKVIGSCGPTTSIRMDGFTPALLQAGLKGMIGKGGRSAAVVEAIRNYKAVYFLAYAGCGALLHEYVTQSKVVAYRDLGPEAIFELTVSDLPLLVAVDSRGKDIFKRK